MDSCCRPFIPPFVSLLVATFVCSSTALGQVSVLSGTVRDAVTNQALSGANVTVEGTRIGASTATNGSFRIISVPVGLHVVRVSLMGYVPSTDTVVVREGQPSRLSFRLEEDWVEIPEIVIERVLLTGGYKGIASLPGSAHYISPADLERFAYTDVGRVLRHVPGVNIQEEDGYGLRPNIGLRGSGSERSSKITVMEDGVLMAPAPYAAPAAYFFPTIGRMQAVEVRKGSSQIKYGPYTTGGAINLVSTEIPSRLSGKLTLLAGNDENQRIHANIGNSSERLGFLLETFQSKSDGFKRLDTGGPTGFDKRDYLAKFRIGTKKEARVYQSLSLKIGHASESSDETYLGLTDADFALTPNRRYAGSQRDVIDSEQKQFVARHFIRPTASLDVTTTAYRTDFSRNWYKLDRVRASEGESGVDIGQVLARPDDYPQEMAILTGATSPNEDALDVKANNRSYYAMGIQTALNARLSSGRLRHEIEVGLRIHEDQIDRFQWVDTYRMDDGTMLRTVQREEGTESNRVERAKAVAAFVQYEIMFGFAKLTPGLRYEHVTLDRTDYGRDDPERIGTDLSERSNAVDALIPGIGLDYHFGRGIHAFGGIHKGFAPPGSREGTRPESSVNYEAGLRLVGDLSRAEAVLFYSDYDNLLGSDLAAAGGGGTTDQFNGGAVRVTGIELSGEVDFGVLSRRGFSIPLRYNYTFTSARFGSSFESEFEPWGTVDRDDELPYVPRHQFTVSAGFESSGFSLDGTANYVSAMRTVAGRGVVLDDQSTDAHVTIDVSGTYRIRRQVHLFATILNLTDAEYVAARRPAGARPGLPRQLLVGIKARI